MPPIRTHTRKPSQHPPPANMSSALATLEGQVNQLAAAMQHANTGIEQLDKTAPADTPTPQNDLTAEIFKAIADENRQKREGFESMKREWRVWGQGVMKSLVAWCERRDLGIADRMAVVGLMDRLAWYGVVVEEVEGGKK